LRMRHGDWLVIWLAYRIGIRAIEIAERYDISRKHVHAIVRRVNKWTPDYRIALWRIAEDKYNGNK